jgi:hypothetical protein
MNSEVEHLIKLAVATGEISDKQKAIIYRKAESFGENLDEVELVLKGELALARSQRDDESKPHLDANTNKVIANVNFFQAAISFINNHKFLKYALIFFLICLGFNLLIVLITIFL